MSEANILITAIGVAIICVIPAAIILLAKWHYARLERQDKIEHYQNLNALYPHLFDKEIRELQKDAYHD